MRFLVISDIHGAISVLSKLEDEFSKADAVIFAGDFAQVFKEETALPTFEALIDKHDFLLSVLGNCDPPGFYQTLEDHNASVEGILTSFDGLSFIGSGGATRFTGKTPNEISEEEIIQNLSLVMDEEDGYWDDLVMIIHNPPYNTKLDKLSSGIHVGSKLIRKVIEDIKPLVVVSGHIHEAYAIDAIGDTVLINPGSLAEGRYAILEIESKGKKFEIKAELKKFVV